VRASGEERYGVERAEEVCLILIPLTVLYMALTVLYLALTVLYLISGLDCLISYIWPWLSYILYLALTVLYLISGLDCRISRRRPSGGRRRWRRGGRARLGRCALPSSAPRMCSNPYTV